MANLLIHAVKYLRKHSEFWTIHLKLPHIFGNYLYLMDTYAKNYRAIYEMKIMITNFKNAVMGAGALLMSALPGFLRAQSETASTAKEPASGITAPYNKAGKDVRPFADPGKTAPSYLKYGDVNDAGRSSFKNGTFVLFMNRGVNSKFTSEEYVEKSREKFFRPLMGDKVDDIVFFIGDDIEDYGGDPIFDVYLAGKLQPDPRGSKSYKFTATELRENAKTLLEKFAKMKEPVLTTMAPTQIQN